MQNYSKLKEQVDEILGLAKFDKAKIVDIVLFGSSVRGKTKAGDIDVCIVTRDGRFGNIATNGSLHLTELGLSTFPVNSMWSTLLHEGISLISGRPYHEHLGFLGKALYWYDLKRLKQKDKVRFFYALKGRKGKKGFVDEIGGTCLAKGVIIVPVGSDDKLKEFFDTWKIPYSRRRILVEK